MKKHFVTIFGCLLGYVGSYAVIVRPEPMPMFCCGLALETESFAMEHFPDYRSDLLNPILTQFYKPIHWVDVKLRPSYWDLEFTLPSSEAAIEVEAY